MAPRTYQLGQRVAAIERTRERIIEAARDLLDADGEFTGFSVEAVARRASVARMTVYYQFSSRAGLLEAVYDDLARRGLVDQLPGAFQVRDPVAALCRAVEAFVHFWASDRRIIRRLRALTSVDAEIDAGIRQRDQWRRGVHRRLVSRLVAPAVQEQAAEVMAAITSFETYDQLADDRSEEQVASLIQTLALRYIEKEPPLTVSES